MRGGADFDTVTYADRRSAVVADQDGQAGDDGEPAVGEGDTVGVDVEGLVGGSAGDTLTGNANPGRLDGGAGNDVLDGRLGADNLIGGPGAADTVDYSARTAAVTADLAGTGGDGQPAEGDTVGADVENLLGGSGPDTLTGNAGFNRLDGNGGDDLLDGGLADDTLHGGPGSDTASYAARTVPVTVNLELADLAGQGQAGESDLFTSTENARGGSGNDALTGSTGVNRLEGGGGNDALDGREQDDTLDGGAGADTHNGGAGTDTVTYASRTDRVVVHLDGLRNDGADPSGNGFSGPAEENDRDIAVEDAIAGSGNDRMTGNAQANRLAGGGGDDILDPRLGTDVLEGGGGVDTMTYAKYIGSQPVVLRLDGLANDGTAGENDRDDSIENAIAGGGNDTVVGDGGDNRLVGSGGDDLLEGGLGSDTLDGRAGTDTITYAGRTENLAILLDNARNDGSDPNGNGGSSVTEEGDEDQSIENAVAGAGNDRVTGSARSNTIRGGDGNDVMDGGPGGDTIDGQNGTDTMFFGFRAAGDPVAVLLDGARNDGSDPNGNGVSAVGEENDRDIAIENATGGSGNDRLTGNTALNVLQGRAGDDILRGRDFTALADQLDCSTGNDSTTSDPSDHRIGCEIALP